MLSAGKNSSDDNKSQSIDYNGSNTPRSSIEESFVSPLILQETCSQCDSSSEDEQNIDEHSQMINARLKRFGNLGKGSRDK